MTVDVREAVVSPATFEGALREFFADRRAEAELIGDAYAAAVAELESYVLRGGKRIRPTFAWLGWIGAGGDEGGAGGEEGGAGGEGDGGAGSGEGGRGAVVRACAALELLHASALIHDDIIDASPTRRGFPAVHVTFAERHRARAWPGDPESFGAGAAILLGDLAQNWADDLVRTSGLGAGAQARVGPVWSALRTEVLSGQLLDLAAEASGDEDIATAQRVNRYKTAAYTVERPLHLGAAIAGAGAELVAAYRDFGVDVGIAFQLRDDLLGVFGDPAETGKPSGRDLRAGKRTVLLATALRLADDREPAAATFLRAKVGTDLSEDELGTIRTLITDLGAVDQVEADIDRRTRRAIATLRASGATASAQEMLAALAIRATQRTS